MPSLPNEIKIQIVEALDPPHHPLAFRPPQIAANALSALSLTSRSFYEWAIPILYRHVTITPSQLSQLVATLSRPPEVYRALRLPILGRHIRSISVTDDGSAKLSRHSEIMLMFLLRRLSSTLERIWFHAPVAVRITQILSTIPSLKTIVIDQNSLAQLGTQTEELVISTDHLFSRVARLHPTITPEDFLASISPAIHLKQIILAEPNLEVLLEYHMQVLLLVALLQRCPSLSRIVIVLRDSDHRVKPETHLLRVFQLILEHEVADPAVLDRLQETIRFAKLPSNVRNTHHWLGERLRDGTAWALDSVPYRDWKDALHS